MKNKRILEIACFTEKSALTAQAGGADRIEFCDNYLLGGITPSTPVILRIRKQIHIPLFVMIRPRGGNFVYNEMDLDQMKKDILTCKEAGCDGVVFGILDVLKRVETVVCSELVAMAKPMESTFHRAFDEVIDKTDALEKIIQCGFTRILTSGGKDNALSGSSTIESLIKQTQNRILIMPGGGIRSENITAIARQTKATELHSSAIISGGDDANMVEVGRLKSALAEE